jgi:hypothetical protein
MARSAAVSAGGAALAALFAGSKTPQFRDLLIALVVVAIVALPGRPL